MTEYRLPRRDRIALIAGLVGVTAVSWAYLVYLTFSMDMGGMGMESMPAGGMGTGSASEPASMSAADVLKIKPWSGVDFLLMFLMWAVMMVGMMTPTAMPMTLIYAAVARKAAGQGTPLAPAAVFIGGYTAMWTLFSVGATAAQWGLDQAALLSPMMVATSPALGASLLIAAGVYQMTPAKNACLRHCRSPMHFISEHWRPGATGAFKMGLEHGAYCLGCCWALMGLLFFGGVMNLLWIAGITLFVLLEKVLPIGARGGRVAGTGMVICGLVLLALM